jgi:hypothetical protein
MSVIADHDLEGAWEMTLVNGGNQSSTFNINVSSAVGGKIAGTIVGGPPLSDGRYRLIPKTTDQYVMSLRLTINGVVIFLAGQLTKPDTKGIFEGNYNRLGLVSAAPALAFDPGETGTGGGNQTT